MIASAIFLTLLGSSGVIYLTGGTEGRFHALAHLYYIPIVIAALTLGPKAGILTAFAASLVGGPLMPADAALQAQQPSSDWLTRAAFFILVGGTVGVLTRQLRSALEAERRRRVQLDTLHEVDKAILSDQSHDSVLRQVIRTVGSSFEAQVACLFLEHDGSLVPGVCSTRSNVQKEEVLALAATIDVVRMRQTVKGRDRLYPQLIACSDVLADGCVPTSSRRQLGRLGLRSVAIAPVANHGQRLGVLLLGYTQPRQFSTENHTDILRVAHQVAIALKHVRQREQLSEFGHEALAAFTEAIAQRDLYTGWHVGRTVGYAVAVAQRFGLSQSEVEAVQYGAQLHDVGKVAIPTDILRKPSALSRREWRIIQEHPAVGSQIIERVSFLRDVAPLILHHHERYDGTGYPAGLRADQIPLGARIIAVVDAFDAMTSDRPYRRALSYDKAIDELRTHAGSQFDPEVVSTFLAVVDSNGKVEIAANGAWDGSLVSATYAPIANVVDYRRQRDVNVE